MLTPMAGPPDFDPGR